jgi:PAS domain S-box-containing protein
MLDHKLIYNGRKVLLKGNAMPLSNESETNEDTPMTVEMDDKEKLALLNSILRSSTEYSIIAKDLNFKILAWNEGAKRIYGYDFPEILKQDSSLLHDPLDISSGKVQKIFDNVLKNGKWQGRITRVRKDGRKFQALATFTLRKDQNDKILGYTVISQDLTEQLRIEKHLEQIKVLEEKSRQTEIANRLKSEFMANMSHELRTPLNAIIGFSELMYDDRVNPLNHDHKEYVADILTSSKHLLSLINDILDLSKIEAGKIEFHPQVCDLKNILTDVLSTLREFVNEKRMSISTFIEEKAKTAFIDPIRLKQILFNYLSNALKFTPDFGSIQVRFLYEPPNFFRFEVEDNGTGINPENIQKLFVEFQQLENKNQKKYSGTGLGLALTKRIVEAQGGHVGVDTSMGRGSVFYAVLPLGEFISPTITKPMDEKIKTSPLKVLVIENNPENLRWLMVMLSSNDYIYKTAKSAPDALELLTQEKFDFITINILLPDLNGWELLKEIRHTLNMVTPVLIMTDITKEFNKSSYLISDFLQKPMLKDKLLSTIRKIQEAKSHIKILAVDDDLMSLKLLKSLLKNSSYNLLTSQDAENALAMIKTKRPDIIILDLLMEKMDGFSFLKKLRQLEAGVEIPVIIWTVKDLTDEELKILKNTAQAIVQKAIQSSDQQLLNEIEKFIAQRSTKEDIS